MLLVILMVKKLEFKVEKVINYMLNGMATLIHLTVGLI